MRGSGGWGGGQGLTARKQSGKRFFSPKLFYSFQRGSNIFQDGVGGVNFFQGRVQMLSIENHITCNFPGRGPDPYPPSGSAHGVA